VGLRTTSTGLVEDQNVVSLLYAMMTIT
jgi:hypothetical protein